MGNLVEQEVVQQKIYFIRGKKVILDRDLAVLYGVETKALIQAVKRNKERFPSDFMYQLTNKEVAILRSQFVTSRWGGTRYSVRAFTEQGVAMMSSVLKSKKAIQVNIAIMRVFVKLREILSIHKELAHKLTELERKLGKHDEEIIMIFQAIKELMTPPEGSPKRKIGFRP
ncbi:MAG: ORF6N domain-containing protein [Candidatus Omnitrophota bacterium]|jgi:hypothetical protein